MDSVTTQKISLLMDLAAALQRVGTGTARVEETLGAVSEVLGVPGRFHALPSAVFGTLQVGDEEITRLVPAGEGSQDLAQLETVRDIADAVVSGRMGVSDARRALRALEEAPRRYGPVAYVAAHGWVSGLAVLLFGGGPKEMLVAALAGLAAGVLARGAVRWGIQHLVTAICGLIAGGLAAAVAARTPLLIEPAVLGGLIVLVPGFVIHRSMLDLASGHVLSGAGRLAQSLVTLLLIVFGVALGARLGGLLGAPIPSLAGPAPELLRHAAILALTPGLLVLFEAPARSTLWNAGAVAVAWLGATVGERTLGGDLGPALGAFAIGIYSNLWERTTGRPAALPLAPGLLILVPGAMALRGVAALQDGRAVAALETGFSALMVATSVAAGLLAAHAVVRVPRRTGARALGAGGSAGSAGAGTGVGTGVGSAGTSSAESAAGGGVVGGTDSPDAPAARTVAGPRDRDAA